MFLNLQNVHILELRNFTILRLHIYQWKKKEE